MYPLLLSLHSIFRWAVLAALLLGIGVGIRGIRSGKTFDQKDNFIRHSTATVAHLQLAIGFALYFTSPIIRYFLGNFSEAVQQIELSFFGLIHIIAMLISVVMITIGSALAKRKGDDRAKYQTMTLWFSLGLLVILLAIPWPFSPWVARPYFRF